MEQLECFNQRLVPLHVQKRIPTKVGSTFAAEDTEKGSCVWSSRLSACKFLALLPADLAYIKNWAYVVDGSQGFGDSEYSSRAYLQKKDLAIYEDLDRDILINSSTYDIEDMDEYEHMVQLGESQRSRKWM